MFKNKTGTKTFINYKNYVANFLTFWNSSYGKYQIINLRLVRIISMKFPFQFIHFTGFIIFYWNKTPKNIFLNASTNLHFLLSSFIIVNAFKQSNDVSKMFHKFISIFINNNKNLAHTFKPEPKFKFGLDKFDKCCHCINWTLLTVQPKIKLNLANIILGVNLLVTIKDRRFRIIDHINANIRTSFPLL